MKTSTLLFFCIVLSVSARAQCLTDFTKLLPEPTFDYTLNYGSTFSMHDNYLAVGLPAHDSLGRLTGLVYVYEKIAADWKKIATLMPSDPADAMQFGMNVKMSSDYILVSATRSGGKVYLFKKPVTGWETQTELTAFTYPGSIYFGMSFYTGLNEPVAISADQQTIAIADLWYQDASNNDRDGAVFVYHKQVHEEWDSNMSPVIIQAPEADVIDFGRPGVAIHGDRVITGAPSSPSGNGKLYIYRDPSGEFKDFTFEAGISAEAWPRTFWLGYYRFICTDEGIFAAMATDLDADPKVVVAFFEKPASGNWSDMNAFTCAFPPGAGIESNTLPPISFNGQDLVASYRDADGTGHTTLVRKGAAGWCNPDYENIDVFIQQEGQLSNRYGAMNAASSQHVVVASLPHPDNFQANVGIKALSQHPDDSWTSELLYPTRQTTAGHGYGRAIVGFEDFLFVGAPYDGTVKQGAGAVYVYRKTGGVWSKTGKILAPVDEPNDNVFGTSIATNGNQLAVGASGFGEHGRIFIYGKKQNDWSEVELLQEIELPEDVLTVFAYGDNVAMSDEWLLIPYVQNDPARIILAIYKHNGTQWEYSQVVELGMASLGAKFTSRAVAIEGGVIVAGGFILEQNAEGLWERRYALSPSDREVAQIAPDFSHWVRNGDMFGHAVAISENSIFISAPQKDFGDTWDVGAIYVFTKKPWESWSSRTETAKILPRVREERELFGYSLKVFGNTLIAGAPGADYKIDGSARNLPGRAYVFQAEDYFWQHVTPLLDFTGDSFVKDYFGISVGMDESDFFISAPIEDIETGKLSGSVYVTPAPPIVKLVPPVCSTSASIDLFGYPFGGTWSGPGLIDAAEGIFETAIAGVGEHVFTYRTESCTYEGKLRITVEEPVDVSLQVASEHFVCKTATTINVPLAVEERPGYKYLWYFRDDPGEVFFPLNSKQSTLSAQYRGEYQVKVSNTVCESWSPVMSIRNEEVELTLDRLERICQDTDGGIALSALPAGGTWTGPGVQNNRFFSRGVSNGLYTVRYDYRSPLACLYSDQIAVEVDRVPVPDIKRTSGDLCNEGEVHLSMTTAAKANVTYTWQHKAKGAADFSSLDVDDVSLALDERGAYRMEARDGACVVVSDAVAVDDHLFALEMKPDAESLTTCDGLAQLLTISHVPGRTYDWYYTDAEQGESTLISGAHEDHYSAEISGYYHAVVRSGLCDAQTPRKVVTVNQQDAISFPNVVTPNGDEFNEAFMVETNTEIVDVLIMNRYGKVIFSGSRAENWNVQAVTPGVYFAMVTYSTCEGEVGVVKGFVQVIN